MAENPANMGYRLANIMASSRCCFMADRRLTRTPATSPHLNRMCCGFSGSGFKHSPATGWMLAALALEQEETVPKGFRADRYVMDRFQNGTIPSRSGF